MILNVKSRIPPQRSAPPHPLTIWRWSLTEYKPTLCCKIRVMVGKLLTVNHKTKSFIFLLPVEQKLILITANYNQLIFTDWETRRSFFDCVHEPLGTTHWVSQTLGSCRGHLETLRTNVHIVHEGVHHGHEGRITTGSLHAQTLSWGQSGCGGQTTQDSFHRRPRSASLRAGPKHRIRYLAGWLPCHFPTVKCVPNSFLTADVKGCLPQLPAAN